MSYITPDIIAVEITNPVLQNKLRIFNVYNKIVTNTFSDLNDAVGKVDPNDELLVLGDFNLHHPLWSSNHRSANRGIRSAQPLLTIIENFHLQLLTAPGTPTHRWKGGESTIDLTFASGDVASRTIHCKVETSLDCDSDHLPIATVIGWRWQRANPPRKRLWIKTDIPVLQQTVKDQLPILITKFHLIQ